MTSHRGHAGHHTEPFRRRLWWSLPPAVAAILMRASTIVVALDAQILRRVDLRPSGA